MLTRLKGKQNNDKKKCVSHILFYKWNTQSLDEISFHLYTNKFDNKNKQIRTVEYRDQFVTGDRCAPGDFPRSATLCRVLLDQQ